MKSPSYGVFPPRLISHFSHTVSGHCPVATSLATIQVTIAKWGNIQRRSLNPSKPPRTT